MKNEEKQRIGFYLIGASFLAFIIGLLFIERQGSEYTPIFQWHPLLLFIIIVLFITALNLIFSISGILFDNKEYEANNDIPAIVKKIRLRGVLFNNIAIILFLMIIAIISVSFYLLVDPPIPEADSQKNVLDSLTVRIGASVMLVFLVQILFKVFKYLLRVAAFYNARADAIEFHDKNQKIDLDKLMDLFTPEKYDITELEKTSIFDGIVGAIKAKTSK